MNETPTNNQPDDIFSYGFDRNLNRSIEVQESPVVYDTINDRVSQNVPSANTISVSIPGLIIVEI